MPDGEGVSTSIEPTAIRVPERMGAELRNGGRQGCPLELLPNRRIADEVAVLVPALKDPP